MIIPKIIHLIAAIECNIGAVASIPSPLLQLSDTFVYNCKHVFVVYNIYLY